MGLPWQIFLLKAKTKKNDTSYKPKAATMAGDESLPMRLFYFALFFSLRFFVF